MYSLRTLGRAIPARQTRLISNYPTLRESKPTTSVTTSATSKVQEPSPQQDLDPTSILGPRMHVPTEWDKKVLVWMKRFKHVDDIPAKISTETMGRTQNRFRIRLANFMMAATVFGVLVMVYTGKNAQERGESVDQRNLDWHKEIQREYQSSLVKTAAEKK